MPGSLEGGKQFQEQAGGNKAGGLGVCMCVCVCPVFVPGSCAQAEEGMQKSRRPRA